MRKTYAYNSAIFGILFGIYVTEKAGASLGFLAGAAVTIIGFFIIRALENTISDGISKGTDAISNKVYDKKKEKEGKSGAQDLADKYK